MSNTDPAHSLAAAIRDGNEASIEAEVAVAAADANIIAEMQQVLKSIPDSISLYRVELEKLLTACIKSQESEHRLINRTKEILNEISTSHEAMLRDQEEENEATIQKKKTKLELEAIYQQIATSNQMEADKQQKLNDLRSNLALLQEELSRLSMPEEGGSLAAGNVLLNEEQELHISGMKKQRAEFARDVENKTTTLLDLRRETSNLYGLVAEEEAKNAQLEETRANLQSEINDKTKLAEKEVRRKASLEKDLRSLKSRIEVLQQDLDAKQNEKKDNEDTLKKKEVLLRESKQRMEKYLKQYDALFRTTHQLTEAMQAQWQKNVELHKDNLQVEQQLGSYQNEIERVQKETAKIDKLIQITKEQLEQVEVARGECDAEKEKCKVEFDELMNGAIETERKQGEILKKKLDEMVREREILNKMLVKASDRTQNTFDLLKIKENTLKNLTNEVNGYKTNVSKQRETIQQLVVEKKRYEKEADAANAKYLTCLEESKLQELQVVCLNQKIVESETRLKQQQNLYEAVRTDRNLYSKQLIEAQEEISEMKRQFKIMNHQIEQLKEEITNKDHALVKEHFDHHKVDKEKEILKNELLRIKKQIQSSDQIISNQEIEVTKLSGIIQEADDEKKKQLKQFANVVTERDNLRNQLILRNQEIFVLYEKIKIQQSTLEKGFVQFDKKTQQLEQLRARIHQLLFEKNSCENQLSHQQSLENEVIALEKNLLLEQNKIRALSDEMSHPLNVHRWRKLEGSDPKRFEKLMEIQNLQKKIIHKVDEIVCKNVLILEKEKLYFQLKTILARQPGKEIVEQMENYQTIVKDKTRQFKNFEKELEMYQMQVKTYQQETQELETKQKQLVNQWIQNQLQQRTSARGSYGMDGTNADGQGATARKSEASSPNRAFPGEFASTNQLDA